MAKPKFKCGDCGGPSYTQYGICSKCHEKMKAIITDYYADKAELYYWGEEIKPPDSDGDKPSATPSSESGKTAEGNFQEDFFK